MKATFLALLAALLLAVPMTAQADTVVDVAIAANSPGGPYEGVFDTLIAAILAADPAVLEGLSNKRQKTVFAPTDDAFAAIGITEGNVDTALSQSDLTQILLYHVVPGRRNSRAVTSAHSLRTLADERIEVFGTELTDKVGGRANIIVTDVEADNGIIHAIDAVVLPFVP